MGHLSGSLYICDLRKDVNEGILYNMFSLMGPLLSIHIRRDIMTRRSLGYAYVNFENALHAELAIRKYNYKQLNGIAMRIMWSQRDPSIRKSGVGNVFIKNLHSSIDHSALYNLFTPFGYILSCKIVTDNDGVSVGYGFVHFEYQEDANRAIHDLNRMELKGKQIYVCPFRSREERLTEVAAGDAYTNLDFEETVETLANEIVTISISLGLEVNEEDVVDRVENHRLVLNTEDFVESQREQMKVMQEELSGEEKEEMANVSSAEIKEIFSKWNEGQVFIEYQQYHDKTGTSRAVDILNDNAMPHFRKIIQKRKRQMSLDRYLVKIPATEPAIKPLSGIKTQE
ncbi:poly(A) binding protein [Carabus blaptoides fortunei]